MKFAPAYLTQLPKSLLFFFAAAACLISYEIMRNTVSPALVSLVPTDILRTDLVEAARATLVGLGIRAQLLCFVGCLLCLILAVRVSAPRRLPFLLANPALFMSLIAIVVGICAILYNSHTIDGTRYFVLFDDAMISMRYARNWANGVGLVWNGGQPVEGYTNFLYVAVMAGIHRLGFAENVAAIPIMAFNWGITVTLLWLMQASLRRLNVRPFWILITLIGILVDVNTLFWTNSGLETPLLALLVTLCVWSLLNQRTSIFVMSLALLPLARSDAFVLAGSLGIAALWQSRFKGKTLLLMVAAAIPTVLHLLFRLAYYGDIFPNTYYLKTVGIEDLALYGFRYGFRFLTTYGLLLIPLLGTIFVLPRLRFVVFICAIQILYFISIGGDAFQFARFAMPILPLIYIGAAAFLSHMTSGSDRATRLVVAGYMMVAIPLTGDQLFAFPRNAPPGLIELGVLLENNTPPGTLVAMPAAGIAPYFAERQQFIDLLGKTDPHIAQVTPPEGLGVLAHNKFDFEYVYQQRQPEVLLTIASCEFVEHLLTTNPPQTWEGVLRSLPQDQDIHVYFQILNADFVSLYLPNHVNIIPPGNRGCVYLRTGSTIATQWDYSGG